MMEYGIINNVTKEENIIFGYNVADAFRRSKLNSSEWSISYAEFID